MARRRDRWWVSALLWVLAVALTLAISIYQRKTGPTYPMRGEAQVCGETLAYELLRSHTTGTDAPVAIPAPACDLEAELRWRRYPLDEPFQAIPLRLEEGQFVAALPSQPPAGKLEYYLHLRSPDAVVDLPSDRATVVRFKGGVPAWASIPHILLMFAAVIFGLRTFIEAISGRLGLRWQTRTTLALIVLGGLVFGPIVQKYAFGEYWTGVPFGWDLTDNKTLLMFLCWAVAAAAQGWRGPVSAWGRRITGAAAVMMLVVYLVPHSMFGSELDYEQVDEGIDPAEAIGQG